MKETKPKFALLETATIYEPFDEEGYIVAPKLEVQPFKSQEIELHSITNRGRLLTRIFTRCLN